MNDWVKYRNDYIASRVMYAIALLSIMYLLVFFIIILLRIPVSVETIRRMYVIDMPDVPLKFLALWPLPLSIIASIFGLLLDRTIDKSSIETTKKIKRYDRMILAAPLFVIITTIVIAIYAYLAHYGAS